MIVDRLFREKNSKKTRRGDWSWGVLRKGCGMLFQVMKNKLPNQTDKLMVGKEWGVIHCGEVVYRGNFHPPLDLVPNRVAV